MSNAYSNLKAAYHLEDIKALRDKKPNPPRHVQIILSDLCNQDCSFCAYRMTGGFSTENFGIQTEKGFKKNPNRMIPFKKVEEILHDCQKMGVKAVQFTGGGEPTLHPDYIKIFEIAQFLGLQTGLVTNGTKFNDWDFPILRRMSWIRVSLDAGHPKTYEKIRNSKLWPRVITNIKLLGKGFNGPLVGVGFVITKDNYKEIYSAAKIVKESGISYMRVAAMFSAEGSKYYKDIYEDILGDIEYTKAMLTTANFKLIDLFSHRLSDLDQGSPKNPFCGYQHFTLYIGGDQKLYRCCTTSYTTHGEIGDLKNQSLKDWWENEATEAYKDFDAQTCHHCQFNAQNELINSLVKNPPLHADFV